MTLWAWRLYSGIIILREDVVEVEVTEEKEVTEE
jgi:predicted RNA-binding protein